jgi:hypothetical protein
MTQAANKTAIYLFCITEGDAFSAEEGLHPLRPVCSLVCEDLVAVVSQVPLEDFGEEALAAHLEDACWLEREARAHETVIEKVMENRAVLPMKFCTIFRSEERVRALLARGQEEFRRALARLREKEEWEVKMYFEPASSAAPQAAEARTNLSGREFLLKRKAEDLEACEAMKEAYRQAQQSFERVSDYVEEIQLKPVPPPDSSGGPKLILDVVCLLVKPRLKAFRQQIERLGNHLSAKGFRFQLTGPWPPYHFCEETPENVRTS